MRYSRRAVVGTVILGVLAAYAFLTDPKKNQAIPPAPAAAAPAPPPPAAPSVSVSPEALREINEMKPLEVDNRKLFDDYASNEVAADKRYEGQLLQVTGIVQAVEKAPDGLPVLRLVTRNQFMPTYARLDAAEAAKDDRIEKLTRGDKVVIQCVGLGRRVGVPGLGSCVLQKAFRRE